jgi:hypothetical protein
MVCATEFLNSLTLVKKLFIAITCLVSYISFDYFITTFCANFGSLLVIGSFSARTSSLL